MDFLDEKFLHKKIKMALYVDYGVLQKIFPKMHVVKAASVKHCGDLTVIN